MNILELVLDRDSALVFLDPGSELFVSTFLHRLALRLENPNVRRRYDEIGSPLSQYLGEAQTSQEIYAKLEEAYFKSGRANPNQEEAALFASLLSDIFTPVNERGQTAEEQAFSFFLHANRFIENDVAPEFRKHFEKTSRVSKDFNNTNIFLTPDVVEADLRLRNSIMQGGFEIFGDRLAAGNATDTVGLLGASFAASSLIPGLKGTATGLFMGADHALSDRPSTHEQVNLLRESNAANAGVITEAVQNFARFHKPESEDERLILNGLVDAVNTITHKSTQAAEASLLDMQRFTPVEDPNAPGGVRNVRNIQPWGDTLTMHGGMFAFLFSGKDDYTFDAPGEHDVGNMLFYYGMNMAENLGVGPASLVMSGAIKGLSTGAKILRHPIDFSTRGFSTLRAASSASAGQAVQSVGGTFKNLGQRLSSTVSNVTRPPAPPVGPRAPVPSGWGSRFGNVVRNLNRSNVLRFSRIGSIAFEGASRSTQALQSPDYHLYRDTGRGGITSWAGALEANRARGVHRNLDSYREALRNNNVGQVFMHHLGDFGNLITFSNLGETLPRMLLRPGVMATETLRNFVPKGGVLERRLDDASDVFTGKLTADQFDAIEESATTQMDSNRGMEYKFQNSDADKRAQQLHSWLINVDQSGGVRQFNSRTDTSRFRVFSSGGDPMLGVITTNTAKGSTPDDWNRMLELYGDDPQVQSAVEKYVHPSFFDWNAYIEAQKPKMALIEELGRFNSLEEALRNRNFRREWNKYDKADTNWAGIARAYEHLGDEEAFRNLNRVLFRDIGSFSANFKDQMSSAVSEYARNRRLNIREEQKDTHPLLRPTPPQRPEQGVDFDTPAPEVGRPQSLDEGRISKPEELYPIHAEKPRTTTPQGQDNNSLWMAGLAAGGVLGLGAHAMTNRKDKDEKKRRPNFGRALAFTGIGATLGGGLAYALSNNNKSSV